MLQTSVINAGHATSKVLESKGVIFRQDARLQSSSVTIIGVSHRHQLRYQVVLESSPVPRYVWSMNALETAARNFVISAKAGRLLERHRSTVLMLRAKDATCSQIQDLLSQHGVMVSESSITRFFRKHLAEVLRLRVQLEQEVDSPPARATMPTAPTMTQGGKMRDLRGPV